MGGNFGARAEAPVGGVVLRSQALHRGVQQLGLERLARRPQRCAATQPLRDPAAAGADLVALLVPGLRHGLQHVAPARHAHARLRREVGAGVDRHLLGREEGVERPAARPGHRLAGLHVDRVDVRPLLAVELDAHEQLVHQPRGLGVLERLALHHVAPMACRIADRQQDRPVLLARAPERLLAPRVPVDGVVLVLEQVGRGLVGEVIGHRPLRLPGAGRRTRPRRFTQQACSFTQNPCKLYQACASPAATSSRPTLPYRPAR